MQLNCREATRTFASSIGKRKDHKHQEIRREHPTSGSQPSRGRVPFVPSKCPVCPTDVLSNLCGITHRLGPERPGCPGTRRTLPRHADTKFLCVFFLYGFSFSVFKPPLQFSTAAQTTTKTSFQTYFILARGTTPILKKTLREFGLKFWSPTNSESRSESCSENRVFT